MAGQGRGPLRIYADTSVFGGCFDAEFEAPSERFFGLVREGRIHLLVSEIVDRELALAPPRVRAIRESPPPTSVRSVPVSGLVALVQEAYLSAGIVGRRSRDDAAHVAAASVARADAIVSWNLRHLVHRDRIRRYNEVNRAMGLGVLAIQTPREVLIDDQA